MSRWVCLKGEEEEEMYYKGTQLRKIRHKLIQLLQDFVINDDSIIDDGFHVRDTLCEDEGVLNYLFETIANADLSIKQDAEFRKYILIILYRLY